MSASDLELRERDLARRIAEKEREIGEDLELIRQTARYTARQVSTVTVAAVAGVALLVGTWVTWRAFHAFGRRRYVPAGYVR